MRGPLVHASRKYRQKFTGNMDKERERNKNKNKWKRRREKYGKQQTKKEKKEREKRDERLFRNEPMEFEAKHDPESLCIVNIYRGPFNEVREMDERFFFYSVFLSVIFFFFFTSKDEKRIGSMIDCNDNFSFMYSITYGNANTNS